MKFLDVQIQMHVTMIQMQQKMMDHVHMQKQIMTVMATVLQKLIAQVTVLDLQL